MTTEQFIKTHKDTKVIVSMQYKSGPFDKTITAYPKGITNPYFVEFKATSVINWRRMMDLLE